MTPNRRRRINKYMTRLAQDNHPESWRILYNLLHPFATAFARKHISNRAQVEDVVHGAFLRLAEVSHRYDTNADGWSFFSKILRYGIMKQNEQEDQIGSARLPTAFTDVEQSIGVIELSAGDLFEPSETLHHSELQRALETAIEELPSSMQEAINLCMIEELHSATAADHVGCTAPTIRKRLSRALVSLRVKLAKSRFS